jgi:valyl-tRNA synthetase
MQKAYTAKNHEDEIYEKWVSLNSFYAKVDKTKPAYTISMPPPNATGTLHLGHATMIAIQDILIRWQRMQGKSALWLPGTDHAAIATQSVVERKLQNEGIEKPREALGREGLLKEIHKFAEGSKATIRNQVKKMGASCDWSREKYTLEPSMNTAVNELFGRMYKDELIYRGGRSVNWCPKMQTTVADDELEYIDEKTNFYHFQYGPFVIGTARPETKFGDKYVVMHPDDKRYSQYKHGETFECEWINGKITATIIKDEAVDPEFGTGVMTITPWHSTIDFEIAQRHNLDIEQVIDFDGKLMSIAGEFEGMNIEQARKAMVEKLDEKGLVVKIDKDYEHRISVNYRGKGVIEPQVMKQWFIDVNKPAIDWKGSQKSIKEVLQDVVRSQMIEIVPNRFNKIYFHWIDNLRDWCISRQIWWGHQIPIWYNEKNEAVFGEEKPNQPGNWTRDPDTLDTWFSSALWTFATLGWPEQTDELEYFHPSAVLETGYDILFFWVARMILASTYALRSDGLPEEKCLPFKTVYLHGMVRDRDGKKMSKSRPETCIDPLDMIEKYGADALRLSLVIGSTPGNDIRLYEEKIAGYRNFINKIWNASRFALMNVSEEALKQKFDPAKIETISDKWIINELQNLIKDINNDLESFRLSDAGNKIYEFLWNLYCDWYLEISKGQVNENVLLYVLRTLLKLLHPFVPFVTEAIWEKVGSEMLIDSAWPEYDKNLVFASDAKELENFREVVTLIRKVRAESKVDPVKKIKAVIYAGTRTESLEQMREPLMRLARLENLEISEKGPKLEKAKSAFTKEVSIYLPLEGLVDMDQEKTRIEKELKNKTDFVKSLEAKLGNKGFVANAPEAVIEKEKKRLAEAKEIAEKLEEQLKNLV